MIEFDAENIKKAGYRLVTPMVITNSDDYSEIKIIASGAVKHGERAIEIIK